MERKRDLENSPEMEINSQEERDYSLILHNDDIHDFDYVIDSLIEICDHDPVQAEQCTFIVHYRGECDVKIGKFEYLKPMYNKFVEKELIVSIN
ncbi:MAG: ATP-dependent Clp protease adaptor ClpS [Bacteroidales bacterium]|jgi:ATP-dependent Clp protease adaptor protein ClpS|nr:ATP-dependent Clp protease adaptor ClpS [Bacteroidales bacterium]